MTTATTTRTIEIEGMTGDECVQKVGTALRGVAGVTTQTVKVGSATFDADQTAYNAARAAVGSAGYRNREAGVVRPNGRGVASPHGAPAAARPGEGAVDSRVNEVKAAGASSAERAAPGPSKPAV